MAKRTTLYVAYIKYKICTSFSWEFYVFKIDAWGSVGGTTYQHLTLSRWRKGLFVKFVLIEDFRRDCNVNCWWPYIDTNEWISKQKSHVGQLLFSGTNDVIIIFAKESNAFTKINLSALAEISAQCWGRIFLLISNAVRKHGDGSVAPCKCFVRNSTKSFASFCLLLQLLVDMAESCGEINVR